MKNHSYLKVPILITLLSLASVAMAAEEKKSARPTVFNRDTAMLAVYGEYNEQHKGTLGPVQYTNSWDMKNASVLATPIMAATYTEGGIRKGVIAIQRQTILNGEVVDSHATAAGISVYVFAFNGKEYVFEKGKQTVTEAGAHGSAPGGTLIKIGRDKYGLLFEGGDIHQGFTNDYTFIISLSTPTPAVVVELETGESYNDWVWEGKIEFIEDTTKDHFVLKVTSQGTKQEINEDKSRPLNKVEYYVYDNGKYQPITDKKYATYKTVALKEIYPAGDIDRKGMTILTVPRKLLR